MSYSIKFEKTNDALLMYYEPAWDYENIQKSLGENGVHIRGTFYFKREEEREKADWDEHFVFRVGENFGDYYLLDKDVFGIKHDFYFSKSIKFELKLFVAERNISIISQMDQLIDEDVYVTDSTQQNAAKEERTIPFDVYKMLVDTFPNSTEIRKYVNSRVAQGIKNYFDGLGNITAQYEAYLNRRTKTRKIQGNSQISSIKLDLFQAIYGTLKEMLNDSEGYPEREWQAKIQEIICTVYPRYIYAAREIEIGTDERHKKRPDFLLVDSDGFVDILEIKKPNIQRLITKTTYRNNYIADREMEGAIVQIEKYIYTLNRWGKQGEETLKYKLGGKLTESMNIRITNPQGILVMGRSINLSDEEKFDLEIIRRQYKHIVDVITYDDLLERVKHIMENLSR